MTTVILMLVMMCVLIIPHEFGHFITAKACGVQVNEFSVGMGPLIYQKQKGETLYSLRLVPFGGYCAMEGENEESDNPRSFNNKPAWKKLIIVSAGAIMNVLIAVVIMSAIVTYGGYATNTIGEVDAGSPASAAGIVAGDTIIEVNGNSVDSWEGVIENLSVNQGEPIDLTLLRDSEPKEITVTPILSEDERWIIGIRTKPSHNVFVCTWLGMKTTWNLNKMLLTSFKDMFTHGVGKDDIAGPVGMASVVSESAKAGFINYIYFLALISLNLAIINILPFPALDGGRIVFIIIRKVTGNMITDDIEGYVHAFGMVILLVLFVIVTWNDIMRLFFR